MNFQQPRCVWNKLRDRFENGLKEKIPNLQINGEDSRGQYKQAFFPGIDGEAMLMKLDLFGIAASHGSACSSARLSPPMF